MRRDRPSFTSACVAALRALHTELPARFGLAADPYARDLVPFPLDLPARALARAPWAGAAVHHALRVASMGLSDYVALRTRALDDAARAAVADGAGQCVILGAGLDSRALRMTELAAVRVFEVDHPSTQRYKLARLAALPAAPRPTVHVAVDFERERLDARLLAEGFDPARRSFWIWEGVVAYLTRDAIAGTLAAVGALAAPGSGLALTYSPTTMLSQRGVGLARRALDAIGEPLRSPLAPAELAGLLERHGFRVVRDESSVEWAARYWPGQRGARTVERMALAERA